VPRDLPVVERHAVRVVVRDATGAVLLFRAREVTLPELGFWWELPGGGLEPGEDYRRAAGRELFEETGIDVDPDHVGPPRWRRSVTFRTRGGRRLQHEVVVAVALGGARPRVDTSRQLTYELEDYVGFHWLAVPAMAGSSERFFPARLPALLPRFLAGETVAEQLEHWS
jgi:8-oxo-dGTP pyrophosphatase MutT (NUDIX family)